MGEIRGPRAPRKQARKFAVSNRQRKFVLGVDIIINYLKVDMNTYR